MLDMTSTKVRVKAAVIAYGDVETTVGRIADVLARELERWSFRVAIHRAL